MKKKILLLLLICTVAIVFTGCETEEKEKKEEEKVGAWKVNKDVSPSYIDEEELFTKTMDSFNPSFKPIALLGKQVVSGTNYMYLAKEKGELYIIIVYDGIDSEPYVPYFRPFDINEFAGKDIKNNSEPLTGGWNVEIPGKAIMLDEKVQEAFDNATSKITDITYSPIGVLGTQVVAGTNYAILCYGKGANDGIYVVTLYDGVDGTQKIINSAYLDLAKFNG
jgi:hypothetical protein